MHNCDSIATRTLVAIVRPLAHALLLIAMVTLIGIATAEACGCACGSNADCHNGNICNLAEEHCIEPDGSCQTDQDCGDGQLCRASTGVCEDVCNECLTDSDCDDGSFCNGNETCNRFNECVAGDFPCGDGVGCTLDGCDENSDSCTNTPVDDQCDDGLFCTGTERCDSNAGCIAGDPIDCGAEDFCGISFCDEDSQGCLVVPRNEGIDCGAREQDTCTLSAVCSTGACFVTPLCDEQCQRCDPAGCTSLCGNPLGQADDSVNTTDALFTLRAAVELEQCNSCICDVNGDGVVTCVDTLMMLRQIVGLGDIFLCPTSEEAAGATTTTTLP